MSPIETEPFGQLASPQPTAKATTLTATMASAVLKRPSVRLDERMSLRVVALCNKADPGWAASSRIADAG